MTTRSKAGIIKPKHPYVGLLHAEDPKSLDIAATPPNISVALSTPQWHRAMEEEF